MLDMRSIIKWMFAALLTLAFGACSTLENPTPAFPTVTPRITLRSYQTVTATPSPTTAAETVTPLPSPTPTPRTHTVTKGELISSIALHYGLTSQQLLDANPGVNPNLLIAGTVLVIPAAAPTPQGFVPSPTPLSVQTQPVKCYPVSEGGAWCFSLVTNLNETAVENVGGLLRLADAAGTSLAPAYAYTPLNLLPAGKSLPLIVYLPPPLPGGLQASMELLTALPIPPEDTRYLPATLENSTVQILQGGLSAEVSCEVLLGEQASQIWVAAVAYNAHDDVVGVRRWESQRALSSGERLPMVIRVYSVADAIARVELLVEARR